MSKEDGGPAFPVADYDHMVFEPKTVAETKRDLSGMSLRDYFAAKALTAFMQWELSQLPEGNADSRGAAAARYSKQSYVIADAMLAARSA